MGKRLIRVLRQMMVTILTLALLAGLFPWANAVEVDAEELEPAEVQESEMNEGNPEPDSPAPLSAGTVAYPVTGGNIYFDPSTGTVTGCDRTVTSATIPTSIAGSSVTMIGYMAFESCIQLNKVTLPSSIIHISGYAFWGCSGLTDIVIGEGVTDIGDFAFSGCRSLVSITIPKSVTTIGMYAFESCRSLSNVIIGDGVTDIGDNAFYNCAALASVKLGVSVVNIGTSAFYNCQALTTITIPSRVSSIGLSAFGTCDHLTAINVDSENPYYSSRDGVLFDHQMTSLIQFPGGKSGEYAIPDGIVEIADRAFAYSNVTGVTIPDSVTTIGEAAFDSCSGLTGVTIPDSVTTLKMYAFYNCLNLTRVAIPNGITTVKPYTFHTCRSLTSVVIPSSVKTIDVFAFSDCTALTDVYYLGTEDDWDSVSVDDTNETLITATIHCLSDSAAQDGTTVAFRQTSYTGEVGSMLYIWADLRSGSGNCEELAESLTWTSSDPAAFPVNSDLAGTLIYGPTSGEVFLAITPQAVGTAVLTLETANGASASCRVTATSSGQGVTLTSDPFPIQEGGHSSLYAYIRNPSKTAITWAWTSSNPAVVSLNTAGASSVSGAIGQAEDGSYLISGQASIELIARSAGTADITITLSDGSTATRQITVLSESEAKETTTITSNSYNVPKYQPSTSDQAETNLDRYRNTWYDAYRNYASVLKSSVKSASEESETGRKEILQAQAEALQARDEAGYDRFLTIPAAMPEEWRFGAYWAICSVLLDSTQEELDLSNVDLSDAYTVDSNLVKEIAKNFTGKKETLIYDGVEYQIKIGGFSQSYTGSITCKSTASPHGQSYPIVVCSTQTQCREVVAKYLNEIKNLEYNSVSTAFNQLLEGVLGDPLGELAKSYTKQYVQNLEQKLEELGLKDAGAILLNGYEYYQKYKELRDRVQPGQDQISNLEAILNAFSFDETNLENKAAKTAAEALKKAQNQLTKALLQYSVEGTVPWEEDEQSIWDWLFAGGSKTSVNCPVDVSVYNTQGEQIGYAGSEGLWYDDSIYLKIEGEAKTLYAPAGQELTLRLEGTDYGTLCYSVEQYRQGEPEGRLNFYEIPLEEGTQLTARVPAQPLSETTDLLQIGAVHVAADEYISASDSARADIMVTSSEDTLGEVSGAGAYVRGDAVVLYAFPEENAVFDGWYEDDILVSLSAVYEFAAREDRTLTAHFSAQVPSLENYLVELTAPYEGRLEVWIEQNGYDLTLHLTTKTEDLDLAHMLACVAAYDSDGKMNEFTLLSAQQTAVGIDYTGTVPVQGGKLILLDSEQVPVMEACLSN